MKLRDGKFHLGLSGVRIRDRALGKHSVRDVSCWCIKDVRADVVGTSVRREDRVEKMTASMATLPVTKVYITMMLKVETWERKRSVPHG